MPDDKFRLEVRKRYPRTAPLVSLPRGGSSENNGLVKLYLELAKGEAGCAICDRPIPKGSSRLKLVIRLSRSTIEIESSVPSDAPEPRGNSVQYFLHPGCLTTRMGQEVIRSGESCWDCGVLPEQESGRPFRTHPFSVFTTSKFAPTRLCGRCSQKPKWMPCHVCHVYFPAFMISKVIGAEDTQGAPRWASILHTECCNYCARRHNFKTEASEQEAEEEYRRLRDRIAKKGIFDA